MSHGFEREGSMEQKDLKPVYVEWVDPHSIDPWTPKEDINSDITLVKSVGFLIRQEEANIVLALNYDEAEDTISCVMVIPKVCIKKMQQVKVLGELELIKNERP